MDILYGQITYGHHKIKSLSFVKNTNINIFKAF